MVEKKKICTNSYFLFTYCGLVISGNLISKSCYRSLFHRRLNIGIVPKQEGWKEEEVLRLSKGESENEFDHGQIIL